MKDELLASYGIYHSAFLKMDIDTGESLLSLGEIAIQTEATYFHEYIHFLQDITTTYGLMNICAIVDYIKLANKAILESPDKEFKVPITPELTPNNDVKANWELKVIYAGSGFAKNINVFKINSICKCAVPIKTKDQKAISPEKLVIDFVDNNGKNQKYVVGAYAISESMAYTMEKQLYAGNMIAPPQLPYEVVKLVCDYLLPGFSDEPLNIIALCDVSLMLFNPGAFLYDILMEMIKDGYFPKTPQEIYHRAYSKPSFNYNGHTTVQQLLISQSAFAGQQLSDYFATEAVKSNQTWINYILSSAVDFRINNPYFMLDIISKGQIIKDKKGNNPLFAHLLHKLGSPATINNDNEMTFIQPTMVKYPIHPEYMWVVRQIYSIYSSDKKVVNGTYRCEMIEFCNKSADEHSEKQYTDERCRCAPWERAKDEKLCSFAAMWRAWGLEDKSPKES